MERVDKWILHFRKSKKSVLIFEFPVDYPDSIDSTKIEYWKDDLKEFQTKKLNELAKKMRRSNLIYFALNYFEKNEKLWEKEILELNKKKERENFKKTIELAKSLGIPRNNMKSIRRELEKLNSLNFVTKEISHPTSTKVELNDFEKEKEMANNIPQASGTLFKLIKGISFDENLELNLKGKTEIISNLKALSSMMIAKKYQILASKEKVIVDVLQLIEYSNDDRVNKYDAFIEEILIHSTFIVFVLCNFSNCLHCLKELRIFPLFWKLSKSMNGAIRHHSNIILQKSGKNLTLSMGILKLLNQQTFSDFKFICFDETIIHAHKFILNAFFRDFDLSLNSVILPKDISSFAAFKFLEFIYASCMINETKENIKKMKFEGIDGLTKHFRHSEISDAFQNLENKYKLEKSMGNELDAFFEKKYLDLLYSKEHSDVSILCINSNSNEIESIPAHKAILACGSEYFDKMFSIGLSESLCDSIEGQFNSTVTRIILYYLYTDTSKIFEDLNPENVIDCLYASDLYMINSLKSHCEQMLAKRIDLENYDLLKRIADEFNCEILTCELNKFQPKWGFSNLFE
jgi:hypothetical protein